MSANIYFIVCVIFCGIILPVASINVNKIDTSKVLNDDFVRLINDVQTSWRAGRNYHVESELRNLISVNFTRVYKLETSNQNTFDGVIPSKFDSRLKWSLCKSIGLVKAQGNCASSYAIVAASVFTDRLCVQKHITRSSSAEQLLSCCKSCGGGCFGGFIENSYFYMKKIGLVSGGDYKSKVGCLPYGIADCSSKAKSLPICEKIRSRTPSCYTKKCIRGYNASFDGDKMKMTKVYAVPSDVNAIKMEIMLNGPVSATISVFEDFFNYRSGVYCHRVGVGVGKHDVKIIGWDSSNKSKSHWIVVNSWGKTWGSKGTFKIRLGVNECDIESHVLTGSFL